MSHLHFALRSVLRQPGFAAVAMLTLALGIGACTTMFSVIRHVMLKPLPVAEQDALMVLWGTHPERGITQFSQSVPNYFDYRAEAKSFSGLVAMKGFGANLTAPDLTVRLEGNEVSASLTVLFGWQPLLGRGFLEEEDRPGAPRVVLLAEHCWRTQFGADPAIVGQRVDLNGEPHEIVGVLPASASFADRADLFRPLAADLTRESRDNHELFVVGRLKSGVTRAQAEAEVQAIAAGIAQANPGYQGWSGRLESLRDVLLPQSLQRGLVILFVAVLCVLLVACANVANLLLSRALSREREFVVRLSLGAQGRHLAAQLLAESAALGGAGIVAGVILALWGVAVLRAALPADVLRASEITIDGASLVFALATCALVTVGAALAPLLHGLRRARGFALNPGGRTAGAGRLRNRVRSSLVVAQIALSAMLLVGAGLLLRSFLRVQDVDPGFRATGVLTFQLTPNPTRYNSAGTRVPFYRTLLERLAALPGVAHVGLSSGVPFGGGATSLNVASVDPSTLAAGQSVQTSWRIVSPDYFQALQIRRLEGRAFDDFDTDTDPRGTVMIISQKLARQLWPDASAVGKRLDPGANGDRIFTVVGVVDDVIMQDLTAEEVPGMYFPVWSWWGWQTMTCAIRADIPPETLANSVRSVMHEIDPQQAVFNFRTMESLVAAHMQTPRLSVGLLGGFAALALVLAAVGLYGLMAASVAQRTNEIGVRMALGAQVADIVRLVLGQALRLVLLGIALGLAAAFGAGRLLTALLYNTSAHELTSYAVAGAVLGIAAVLASWIPARRAASVDPVVALRAD